MRFTRRGKEVIITKIIEKKILKLNLIAINGEKFAMLCRKLHSHTHS